MAKKKEVTYYNLSAKEKEKLTANELFFLALRDMREAKESSAVIKASSFVPSTEIDKHLEMLGVPSLGLQWALRAPGFALGRVMTLLGFEGSSKTSFMLWLANLAIEAGGLAAMVETENAGSSEQIKYYIKQPDKFYVPEETPDTLEQSFDLARYFLKVFAEIDPENKLPKVLVFDSIGGIATERAMTEDHQFGDQRVGGKSLIVTDAVEVLKVLAKKTNTLLIFGNQAKDKINTSAMKSFMLQNMAEWEKITGPGGRKLPFDSTFYIYMKKRGGLKDKEAGSLTEGIRRGFSCEGFFMKNKVREPYFSFTYQVVFGKSLSFVDSTLEILVASEILGTQKNKAGYYWAPGVGISEEQRMKEDEFYNLIHSPGYIEKFQEAMGINCKCTKIHHPIFKDTDEPAESTDGQALPDALPEAHS